jgi:uncharacterized protein Usg
MTSLLIVPPQLVAQFSLNTPVFVLVDITYRRPDFRHILQQYTQDMPDLMPFLPRVSDFLYFWMTNLDGPIVEARYLIRGEAGNNLAQYTLPKELLN